MRLWAGMVFFFFVVFISGCSDPGGFEDSATTDKKQQQEEGKKIALYLFSTGWCGNCKTEIPEIERQIDTNLSHRKKNLTVTVYVSEGYQSPLPPNPIMLEDYKNKLGVGFEFKMDDYPWKKYRSFFKRPFLVLSAVVLDEDGSNVKTFKNGTYTIPGLIDYLETRLKGR